MGEHSSPYTSTIRASPFPLSILAVFRGEEEEEEEEEDPGEEQEIFLKDDKGRIVTVDVLRKQRWVMLEFVNNDEVYSMSIDSEDPDADPDPMVFRISADDESYRARQETFETFMDMAYDLEQMKDLRPLGL